MAFALPLLANGISGDTSYVQLLDDFDSSGDHKQLTPASMRTLESWTVWADVNVDSLLSKLALVPVMCSHVNCKHRDSLSNLDNQEGYICFCLVVNAEIGCLQTPCDVGDGRDAAVPMVPFTAPAGVNFIAGSTYHGSQMPHFPLPPPPCQRRPEARSSPVESGAVKVPLTGSTAALCRLAHCTKLRPTSGSRLGVAFCLLWQPKVLVKSISAHVRPEVGFQLARR